MNRLPCPNPTKAARWPVLILLAVSLTPLAVASKTKLGSDKGSRAVRTTLEARDLEGVWEDGDTRTRHTLAVENGSVAVTRIVDGDGEVFRLRKIRWDGHALRWSYYVPSTSYVVDLATDSLLGDTLWCSWSNQAGASGSQSFLRVERGR